MNIGNVTSLNALAKVFKISQPTASAMTAYDGFPEPKDGKYDVQAIAEWIIKSEETTPKMRQKANAFLGIEDGEDELMAGDSPALERYRLAKAKREELKLAQERKELVELDAYLDDEKKRYSIACQLLNALPRILPVRLESLTSKEIEQELQNAVNDILYKLRRDLTKDAEV